MSSQISASRRDVLALLGTGAASVVLPGPVFGQSPKTVKVLLSSQAPLLAWGVSFLADALGYYKEEGLTVEFTPMASGPASMTGLVAGAGHVNFSAPAEALPAIARGQKFKALMALSNYNAIYIVVSKDYAAKYNVTADMPLADRLKAMGNFKGMRFGITAPGSTVDVAARLMMKQAGLNPDTDVQMVALGSTTNSMAALSRGAIDGFVATPPTPEITVAQFGAISLFSVGRDNVGGLKSVIGHIVEARASDVEQSPELFSSFVRAGVRSFRYLQENTKEAGDLIYKNRYASMITADVWPNVWNNNVSQFRTPLISRDSVASWISLGMVGEISDPNGVKLDDFVDMRLVNEAAKSIGWTLPS